MSCMTSFIDHMILIRSGLGSVAIFCQFSELLVDWVQEYSSWWNYLACWDQFFLFIKLLTAVQKSRKCGTFSWLAGVFLKLPSLPRLPRLQFSVHMTKHSLIRFLLFLRRDPGNETQQWGREGLGMRLLANLIPYTIQWICSLQYTLLADPRLWNVDYHMAHTTLNVCVETRSSHDNSAVCLASLCQWDVSPTGTRERMESSTHHQAALKSFCAGEIFWLLSQYLTIQASSLVYLCK